MDLKSTLLLIPVIGALSACGGGNSGPGDRPPIDLVPPTYTGASTPVLINLDTANEIAARYLDVGSPNTQMAYASLEISNAATAQVIDSLDQNANDSKKQISTSPPAPKNCTDGGTFTQTGKPMNYYGVFTLNYQNCQEGNLQYSGYAAGSVTTIPGGSLYRTNYDLTITSTIPAKSTQLSGYVDFKAITPESTGKGCFFPVLGCTSPPTYRTITNNLIITDLINTKSVYLNFVGTSTGGSYTLSPGDNNTGELSFSDIGQVNVTTITPLEKWYGRFQEDRYIDGEIKFTGANNSSVRINLKSTVVDGIPVTLPMTTKISVDRDGDGAVDFEGYRAGIAPGTELIPVITTAPLIPTLGLINLSALESLAPGGKALGVSWQIISKPADSTAILFDPQKPEAHFIADIAGDYTILLQISDGVSVATANVSITVVNP